MFWLLKEDLVYVSDSAGNACCASFEEDVSTFWSKKPRIIIKIVRET
jgi:hypothetical protein